MQSLDTHYARLEELTELARNAAPEDYARLARTIELINRTRQVVEHTCHTIEKAEQQLEALGGHARQRRYQHAVRMARLRKILDSPLR